MARNRNLALDSPSSLDHHLPVWFVLVVLAAMIAALLHPAPAHGQWPAGGRSIPGGGTVSDGAGNVIAHYQTFVGSNLFNGLAKIDTSGAQVWSMAPWGAVGKITSDGAGGVLVIYSLPQMSVARVNTAGVVQWSGAQLTSASLSTGDQMIRFTKDAAGNAFASWKTASNQLFLGKISSAGVSQWGSTGTLVNSATNALYIVNGDIVPDESGGCYFVWEDFRANLTIPDIYVQHVLSNGTIAWTTNGLPFATGAPSQGKPSACSDGAGGMIVAWKDNRLADFDVWIQRLDANGNSLWTAGGIRLYVDPVNNIQDQGDPYVLADGAGGAYVAWADYRNGFTHQHDIYAQHVASDGSFLWGQDGVSVIGTSNPETSPRIVLDGSGGLFVGCTSTGAAGGVVQHLTGAGAPLWMSAGVRPTVGVSMVADDLASDGVGGCYLVSGAALARVLPSGLPAWPRDYQVSATLRDLPGDEGGWLSLGFPKSLPDFNTTYGSYSVTAYSVWRKRPGSSMTGPARLEDPKGILATSSSVPSVASYLTGYTDFPSGTWDLISYTPRMPIPTYSFLVPTHTDSSSMGPGDDDFAVISVSTTDVFAVSPPFSAHSVDNLAPGAPQNLAGGRSGNGVLLQWSTARENDFWHYAVYRGTAADFVPSSANRIGQPTSASLQDDGFQAGVSYYKVSTVDRHGNESTFALLTPSQIVSVPPGSTPGRTYLSAAAPNPFHGLTALEFGLAHRSPVTISIYDMSGRLVRTLLREVRDAGVYRAIWNGDDDSRRTQPSAVYFARFEGDGLRRTLKIVRAE
jgi:hypothetical protein